MKLRNQLVILTTATCLPILIFAALLIFLQSKNEAAGQRQRLSEIANELSSNIDRELRAAIDRLEVLATSSYLDSGDLGRFYQQAVRVLDIHAPWEAFVLVDPSGQQVANTRVPFGSPLPMTGIPVFNAAVVKTRQPVVSNLFLGGVVKTPVIAIGVPVIRNGAVKYTLTSSAARHFLTDLLKRRMLPAGWLAIILDRNRVIIGRLTHTEQFFDQPATPLFSAKSKSEPQGIFTGVTKEGIPVSAAYRRSEFTGWTVGVAVPTVLLEAPMRRSFLMLALGGTALLMIGCALAFYFVRRITLPIASLSESAAALGRGETPVPLSSPILEINQVAQAMQNAAAERFRAEAERTRLLRALESSLNEIYIFDADTLIFEFVNHGACRNLGFSLEQLRRMTILDIKPEFSEESFRKTIAPLVRGETEFQVYYSEHLRSDRSRYPVEVHLQKVQEIGRVSLLAVILDITERKVNEAHIQQLNRVYAVLSEINKAIVRVRDPQELLHQACRIAVEKGKFLMAWTGLLNAETGLIKPIAQAGLSEGYVENLQIEASLKTHALGPTATAQREGIHDVCNDIENDPRMAPWRDEALRRGYRSSAAFPLKIGVEVVGTFNLYSAERGFFNPEELTILDELAADIGLALEIHRYESEKLRAENSLRESEERFRQLTENIHEVFWLSTPDKSRMIYVSPGYESIWGRNCRSLYDSPRDWLNAIHPEDRDNVLRAALREPEDGAYDQEYRIVRPDGAIRWIRDRAFPVRNGAGAVYRIAGIAEDITDRKRAEETLNRAHEQLEATVNERTRELSEANVKLQELDRLKSQFLANMSHELRTPLNAIIGFSELMHDGKAGSPVSAEHKEYLGDILDSGRHLLNLINDILDLSKVEAARMELLKSTVSIEQIIVEVVQNIAPIMTVNSLKLIREIPPNLPPITTDKRKLLQIVLNLASNAVKFTSHGEITIRCEVVGGNMNVCVSDTGIGIKSEELQYLFQPFSQINDSLRKRYEGTGLGLYLSKRLAQLLGGDVSVISEYGKGSTFTLTVPVND